MVSALYILVKDPVIPMVYTTNRVVLMVRIHLIQSVEVMKVQ